MDFSGKTLLMAAAAIIILGACSGKQSTPVAEFVPAPSQDHVSLSPSENAVLKTQGQIDKNLPDHAMPAIVRQYKYYLRDGRATMCSLAKRSEQYLAYAREVFRKRGMPEELANLAIIESGYKPEAVSRAGAAGAWQFMPATGAKYGLAQDAWQDERLDPYRATEAAADYLSALHDYFGDWATAIAAYNSGEGKMLRAKAGTGAENFFEVVQRNEVLDEKARLREETTQYVPRFLAVTKIMRDLPKLGFDPIQPENQEGASRLTVAPGTDLQEMSRACSLGWNEFSRYNRHHKRLITCTDRKTYVYVPSRAKQLADQYLASGNQGKFAGWRLTQAKAGDTLEKISKRGNISLAKLKAANPGAGVLKAGQTLLLPPGVTSVPPKAVAANAKVVKAGSKTASSSQIHTIKSKETLYSIARKYNVDIAALKAHNNIADASQLRVGQALRIPGASVQAQSRGKIGGKKPAYTVQPKDTYWSIARKFNVGVADLQRWNAGGKNLKPGDRIVVAEE